MTRLPTAPGVRPELQRFGTSLPLHRALRRARGRLAPIGLILAGLAAACTQEARGTTEGPLELARGFRPRPVPELAVGWDAAAGLECSIRPDPTGACPIELRLGPSDWQRRAEGGDHYWFAPLPEGSARYADRMRARLRLGGKLATTPREPALSLGAFRVLADGVLLRTASDEPPVEARLELELSNGSENDGRWFVRVGRHYGVGLPVWSGESETVEADIPPGYRLSFTPRHSSATAESPALFTVRLGETTLVETRLEDERTREWIRVDLPEPGLVGARLTFEVEGPPGLGCFANPVLTARDVGDYQRRPWQESRPNVVLFLADTFRADNLAAGGGRAEDTPNLNRLADESVRFLEARSSAAWTLPSISALMSGRYPVQVGVHEVVDALPGEVVTLAEHFARAGYRTGAVTDASFFGTGHGLHQGFGWFWPREMPSWSLDQSIADAAAFLEGDDGRPVFLVLHTYRTHDPYRTGREESDVAMKALVSKGRMELRESGVAPIHVGLALKAEAHELYRSGVRALDECFGDFRRLLEEEGVLPRGYLAFTSDHGEAFGENGAMKHCGTLWGSRLRVPLLLHGPDLAPREVSWTVSNVDLAPTLAGLAGLATDPGWVGCSLLEAEADRTVFAFRNEGEAGTELAIVEGRRKLIATGLAELEAGRAARAFDLDVDREEENNLAPGAPWASELAERNAPRVRAFLEGGLDGVPARIDPSEQRALRELGYAGADG